MGNKLKHSIISRLLKTNLLNVESNLTYFKSSIEKIYPDVNKLIFSAETIKKQYPGIANYYPDKKITDLLPQLKTEKKTKAAIVFNSGHILNEKLGNIIDNHDIVIRINFMPTKGFEEYVGSKTSIRICGREWFFMESEEEILLHTYNRTKYYESDISNFKNSELLKKVTMYVSDSKKINGLYSKFLGGVMTNGFRAVIIGLSLCDEVVIFGGDKSNRTHKEGEGFSHFPTRKELPYIKSVMEPYGITQDFNWYFEPIVEDKNLGTMHGTIKNEYLYYHIHPKVSFYKESKD